MTTITLKINERTKAGKTLISMLNFFSSEKEGVEIIKTGSEKKKTTLLIILNLLKWF